LLALAAAAGTLADCSSSAPKPAAAPGKQAARESQALPGPVAAEPLPAPAPPPSVPLPSSSKVVGARPGPAAAQGAAPQGEVPQAMDSERYGGFVENPFKAAAQERLSTFAADVDTASYSNVRRFLKEGRLPPTDAVRIEELVNYFDYGWKEPSGGSAPIAVTSEAASSPWNPEARLLAIGLRTRSVSAENLPPANLVFLIDSSGSMSDPDKLPLVKRAFSILAETMRPQDRVAIVAYAGSAGLVLPSTPGSEKARILESLERLGAGGSTAGGAGIVLAYDTALRNLKKGGNNRVILATDGDFNVGPSSDAELEKLIGSYRSKGVFLSVMGFGTGNLNDRNMKTLADKGNGNYSYIDSVAEARRVLVEEMGATLLVAAKDVKIQVEFDPASVESWRLVGYESRLLAAEDFANDAKDAGEMGAGHRVTALYEILPAPAQPGPQRLGIVRVRYKKPDQDQSSLLEFPIDDGAGSYSQASADFRFAASVAMYGLLLRDSKYAAGASWAATLALARGSMGDSDRRAEFAGLAELASKLKR
jgi:Ca-activated chloride channel family protein